MQLVQPAYVQPAYVQPAYVQPAVVQPAVVQPAVVQPAYVQPAYVQPAVVQRANEKGTHVNVLNYYPRPRGRGPLTLAKVVREAYCWLYCGYTFRLTL